MTNVAHLHKKEGPRSVDHELPPNPWTALPARAPFVLPGDEDLVCVAEHLLTDQMPVPFNGARDAAVVFLTLNPGGSSKPDVSAYYREQCRKRLTFETTVPFMTFDDEFAATPGAEYWHARMQRLIEAVGGRDVVRGKDIVRRNILVLQYFPYQSKTYKPLKATLPSQHFGFELCRKAIRDQRLIVFLRNRTLWTKAVSELASVHAVELRNPRSPYVTPKNIPGDGFDRIVTALTDATRRSRP